MNYRRELRIAFPPTISRGNERFTGVARVVMPASNFDVSSVLRATHISCIMTLKHVHCVPSGNNYYIISYTESTYFVINVILHEKFYFII